MYGMMGKMLRVNLNNYHVSEFSIEPYITKYLGGRGVASRIYWEEVSPQVKPYDPENKLIFVNGPLVGTGAQAATVMTVVAKSPSVYPEGYCYGFIAGYFGTEFKKAGYDGVVIEGCASEPVYILVTDSKVEIRKAAFLSGKSTYTSAQMLLKEHGNYKYLTIGVSGERRVRTAIALASHESTLSCGFGAVMGSKNLKAILVKGSGSITVAHPEKLKELTQYCYKVNKTMHLAIPPQTLFSGHGHLLEVIDKGNCFTCGSSCIRNVYRYGKRKDLVALRRCQVMEYYLPWIYGREDEPIETFFDEPVLANDYAIESFELENIVRWLFAGYKAGVLTEKETGLPLSKLGTREFLEKMLHSIAYREGFGDLLAEGQLRAGEKLAAEAKSLFSHQVTGVGQYETIPTRVFVVNSLMIPMEPRAHQPLIHANAFIYSAWITNLMNPQEILVDTKLYHEVARVFWGSEAAGDVSSYEGKALAAVKIQDRAYLEDTLGLCNFTWPSIYSLNTPNHIGDPTLEAKLFAAVTGLYEDELGQYAERIINLQRAILLREGRKQPDADYPRDYLFSEPLESDHPEMAPGPVGPIDLTGNKLDRERYTGMLKEYRRLRGWHLETGIPKPETFKSLGLEDVASQISPE